MVFFRGAHGISLNEKGKMGSMAHDGLCFKSEPRQFLFYAEPFLVTFAFRRDASDPFRTWRPAGGGPPVTCPLKQRPCGFLEERDRIWYQRQFWFKDTLYKGLLAELNVSAGEMISYMWRRDSVFLRIRAPWPNSPHTTFLCLSITLLGIGIEESIVREKNLNKNQQKLKMGPRWGWTKTQKSDLSLDGWIQVLNLYIVCCCKVAWHDPSCKWVRTIGNVLKCAETISEMNY